MPFTGIQYKSPIATNRDTRRLSARVFILDEGLRNKLKQDESTTELVRLAQTGNLAAFEQLYHAESGRVYALCLRMTTDTQQAGQYTQDTFVRAWQNLNTFRSESTFSTWLHRIAVNVVLGDRRSASRRKNVIRHTDDLSQFEASTSFQIPNDTIDLEKQIAALPEKGRMVFILHDIEGYKHAEIAEMMQIAVGTSKAHLHRARMLLKAVLKEQ